MVDNKKSWRDKPWPRDGLPLWKRIFKVPAKLFIIIFYFGIVIGIIFAVFGFWDILSSEGQIYDFFGRIMLVRYIALIIIAITLPIGLYGTYISIKMLIRFFRKEQYQLKWPPKVIWLIIVVFGGLIFNYYTPFWMVDAGAQPEFTPYISYYGESGMLISWDTKESKISSLFWGEDETVPNEIIAGSSVLVTGDANTHHSVLIENLDSGSTYYYKVPEFSEKIYAFRTAPATNSNEPVIFTIVGDTQGGYNIQKQNVKLMLADPEKPDFTCIAGDLVNRGNKLAEWAMLFDQKSYGQFVSTTPFMNAPGNHENTCEKTECGFRVNYKTYFQYDFPGEREILEGTPDYGLYYSYNYSNVHMVSIDNFDNETYVRAQDKRTGSFISTAQIEWLKEDLARNENMWKFVYFHVPMYSTGDFGSNEDLCHQLEPIFEEYGVDAVFYGHDHMYESYLVNASAPHGGIYHFIVGGGGGGIDNMLNEEYGDLAWKSTSNNVSAANGQFDGIYGHEYQLYGELAYHYMKVNVEGETATFTAIRTADGSIIQSFTANRTNI